MFRTHFYGQEISDYGRQNGRVDYHALAASFDAVLCNGILGWRDAWEEWEQISGFVDNSEAIEEAKEKLEEVESKLEEVLEEKRKAESDFDDLERASENIGEILEKFDSFEYEANELHEAISWNDCETPNGDDLDSGTLERNLDCIDLWSMREAIEDHQSLVEEQREGAETALEELEEEAEELKKTKAKLEAELDNLECEDTTEDLTPISWDDVILGDVVIGKAEASEYYGITTEGWKGSITRISRGEDGTPDYFEAVGFDNEPREDGIEPNREWIRLEPHYFDLYRKSEGGDR